MLVRVGGEVWREEDSVLFLLEEIQIRQYLTKLIPKAMDPDGVYSWVQRELADVIVRPLSVILGWS